MPRNMSNNTQILTEEFIAAKDRWSDLRIQLMMRFGDQRTDISNRRLNLSIALISIAAAFLTIVVPLVGGNFSADFVLATIFFFACTILGTFDVLWDIRSDQIALTEDNRWRLQILKEHETEAEHIREHLLQGEMPEKEIRAYFKNEENIITKMRERALYRQHRWTAWLLLAVQYIFILSFFVGFIFLAIAIFPQFESIRF